MLFKQIKYDLLYSRRAFILLGAYLLLVPVIIRIWLFATGLAHDERLAFLLLISAGLVGGVIIVQMHKFFYEGLFGSFGYLSLTLPISRGRLMLSKLLTIGIWIHFIGAIATMVLLSYQTMEIILMVGVLETAAIVLSAYVHSLFVAFFVVSIFFLSTVLAHSSFGKLYVPGIINVVAMGSLIVGYIVAVARLVSRQFGDVTVVRYHSVVQHTGDTLLVPRYSTVSRPIINLSVGRLPLPGTYIDLYIVALSLVAGALALFAAYRLLKNRISSP